MPIDPNHKSGNAALDKACAQIGETFRAERKEQQGIVTAGHRVQKLVQAKRYSFPEACRFLEVTAEQISAAMLWLIFDNAILNHRFETNLYKLRSWDYEMRVWFYQQEEQQPTATVLSFKGAA